MKLSHPERRISLLTRLRCTTLKSASRTQRPLSQQMQLVQEMLLLGRVVRAREWRISARITFSMGKRHSLTWRPIFPGLSTHTASRSSQANTSQRQLEANILFFAFLPFTGFIPAERRVG